MRTDLPHVRLADLADNVIGTRQGLQIEIDKEQVQRNVAKHTKRSGGELTISMSAASRRRIAM